jgi:hypothetical protein
MPFHTVNRQLTAYRAALLRGDLVELCSAAQDRDWIDDLKISADERRATIAFLDELVAYICEPEPNTTAALRTIESARAYWDRPDRYRF